MITETLAKALTFRELSDRLADEHTDPVVRYFARLAFDRIELHNATQVTVEDLNSEIRDLKNDIEEWDTWFARAPR